jgi:hypothetical protein
MGNSEGGSNWPPRQRRRLAWTAVAAVVVIGGAAGAYELTRPGQTCAQQYQAWNHGPAGALMGREADAMASASSALSAGTGSASALLQQVQASVRKVEAYPIPACADPAGYWRQSLDEMSRGETQQGVAVSARLDAELRRTAGVRS